MSPAADEFAIALDRCGWMIVQQPQFGDRSQSRNEPGVTRAREAEAPNPAEDGAGPRDHETPPFRGISSATRFRMR